MKKLSILFIFLVLGVNQVYSQSARLNRGMQKSEDAIDRLHGLIPMRFFDALTGNPISGAVIEIPNVGNFNTNTAGKIAFPVLPDGKYTLIFNGEGYITTPIDFWVTAGVTLISWFSVSPGLSGKDFRIVLEWGETPADLDIHLLRTGGSGNYHISYRNMRTADDGTTTLDRDDTAGYGPETITIGRLEQNAVYSVYIHDFTNRNNNASTQMAQRGATVRVYSLDRLIYTFHIPSNGVGTRWNVFNIEQGVVVPVNTVVAR